MTVEQYRNLKANDILIFHSPMGKGNRSAICEIYIENIIPYKIYARNICSNFYTIDRWEICEKDMKYYSFIEREQLLIYMLENK